MSKQLRLHVLSLSFYAKLPVSTATVERLFADAGENPTQELMQTRGTLWSGLFVLASVGIPIHKDFALNKKLKMVLGEQEEKEIPFLQYG